MPATSLPTPARPSPAAAGHRECGAGDRVTIRALGPADAPLLDAVFAGLGDDSRYWRFHSPKPRLTARDRRQLTATDGFTHVALVALGAAGEPLGIARFVREVDDPEAAEIAVEVIDACQRRGIGAELIRSLAASAAAAGVRRLTADVLAQAPVAAALAEHGWRVARREGAARTFVRPPLAPARGRRGAAPAAVAG